MKVVRPANLRYLKIGTRFTEHPPPPAIGISSNRNGKNNICPPVATNNIRGLSKPYLEFTLCALRKFYWRGVRGYSTGKFCDFSFNLCVFKAILSCFLLIFLSLKIGTFYHLPGQPGQGLKIRIVPGKSGHLAGLKYLCYHSEITDAQHRHAV